MSLFSKFNKENLRNSIERAKDKLGPPKTSDLQQESHEAKSRFQTVSREIRILTARAILRQIHEIEVSEGKLTQSAIEEFAMERSADSGITDKATGKNIAVMVLKLYHLGEQLPDHEL